MTYAAHGHAQLLCELGADVTVIAPDNQFGPVIMAEDFEYKLKTFAISGNGMPWSKVKGEVENLLHHAAAESPDIIISEGWYTPATSLLPKLRAHCRHVVIASHGAADKSIGSFTPQQILRSIIYRFVERRKLEYVFKSLSAAIVLTNLEDTDRYSDNTEFRLRHIPTFISPNFSIYSAALKPKQLGSIKRLLHVGEMLPHKNQLLAVRLLADLPAEYELELAFPIATWYLDRVKQAALEHRVAHRIHYTIGKNRLQLESSFDIATALLVLSRTEAQPIVAVDALCKAIPFASTPVGCMSEMKGGIVALPAQLRDAILRIHASPIAYRQYSEAALHFYKDNYERRNARRSLQNLMGLLTA
jgi:glycosyltransferase involved in cell wall biosynthesis